MKVQDKLGREIYISVYGQHDDDIQIDEAYYTDTENGEVDESTLEYIYSKYASEIYDAWYENLVNAAENCYDGDR